MNPYPIIALALVGCGRSGFDLLAGTSGDAMLDDASGGASDDAMRDGSLDGSLDGPAVDAAPTGSIVGTTFTSFNPSGAPTARRSSGAALEPGASEKLWMYGGYNGGFLADMRHYIVASDAWLAPATTGTSPGQRERHSLAWDPLGNALVVFGGQNRPMVQLVHHDTLHVFRAGTWTPIAKAGTWPAPRKDATLVWVPHLSKFLLYGGNDGGAANNRFDDVHLLTLDSAAGTASWEALSPGGVAAPAQSAGCVVYDPVGRRLIVFGGETADGVDNNLVYQYLVETNVWQLDTTTGTPPAGESFQQCAWDAGNARVLVYGGQNDGGDPMGGYAIYDPTAKTWSVPTPTGNPGARADGAGVYSPTLGGMLWYGGRTATTTYTSELVLMKLQVQ